MLPVPEASVPAMEICWERSAAGMIFSARVTGSLAGKRLDGLPEFGFPLDPIANGSNKLDDQFCHEVAGSGFSCEEEGMWWIAFFCCPGSSDPGE